ncbi:MAG: amidohydrolase [Chloroflexi bacterium]|nr:amidohydrolase [Chloroflexota bacterium]
MSFSANLLLVNARVFTMDPGKPHAEAVAVSGDRIVNVGSNEDILALRSPESEVIDCRALPLLPGINDAHCHVLTTASTFSSVDCGPPVITSIGQLLSAISDRAAGTPPGQWVRGFGLDPDSLEESRFPTRWELDSMAPSHPVRINHSSGHACVLNSLALGLAGIDGTTPDPVEGVIEREAHTGEPTGTLFEAALFLRERLGPTRDQQELASSVSRLSDMLLACGITSVQDAGPENAIQQWQTFKTLVDEGAFRPRVTMMAGARNLGQFDESGMIWGTGSEKLKLGHAKIMCTLTTGSLLPASEDLNQLATLAKDMGFPIAIHAIEQEVIEAVLALPELFETPSRKLPTPGERPVAQRVPRNRIEHCAECPPTLLEKVAQSGATVVTQPGFIYWRGENYLRRVDPALIPHLYDTGSFLDRRVPVAFGSDSPVIDPSPWPAIYCAITSLTQQGNRIPRANFTGALAGNQRAGITFRQAIEAYTRGAARAEGAEASKGAIRQGMLADLTVLGAGIEGESLHQLPQAKSVLTIVGGEVLWRQGAI